MSIQNINKLIIDGIVYNNVQVDVTVEAKAIEITRIGTMTHPGDVMRRYKRGRPYATMIINTRKE